MGAGDYVMGFEPGNTTIDGIEDAIQNGSMKYLEPGEEVEYKMEVKMIKGKEEFNKLTEQDAYLIFVTNEIGLGGVSPDAVQRRFTDLQGWLNQYIASRADEVVFMVSGIPMKVK